MAGRPQARLKRLFRKKGPLTQEEVDFYLAYAAAKENPRQIKKVKPEAARRWAERRRKQKKGIAVAGRGPRREEKREDPRVTVEEFFVHHAPTVSRLARRLQAAGGTYAADDYIQDARSDLLQIAKEEREARRQQEEVKLLPSEWEQRLLAKWRGKDVDDSWDPFAAKAQDSEDFFRDTPVSQRGASASSSMRKVRARRPSMVAMAESMGKGMSESGDEGPTGAGVEGVAVRQIHSGIGEPEAASAFSDAWGEGSVEGGTGTGTKPFARWEKAQEVQIAWAYITGRTFGKRRKALLLYLYNVLEEIMISWRDKANDLERRGWHEDADLIQQECSLLDQDLKDLEIEQPPFGAWGYNKSQISQMLGLPSSRVNSYVRGLRDAVSLALLEEKEKKQLS